MHPIIKSPNKIIPNINKLNNIKAETTINIGTAINANIILLQNDGNILIL